MFWENDGTLVSGRPHIRPQNWDKPKDPLAKRFGDFELARKGNSLANTYTVTLNSGEVIHQVGYHLLFENGTWRFNSREQELPGAQPWPRNRNEVAAKEIASIRIN